MSTDYHIQQHAPFTIGCFGPMLDGNNKETLVTLAKCRELYDGCSAATETYTTSTGDVEYKPWCPCYDGAGSNVESAALAVFEDTNAITTCTNCTTGTSTLPTTATAGNNADDSAATSELAVAAAGLAVAAIAGLAAM